MFAALLAPILAWCPACMERHEPQHHAGAWGTCDIAGKDDWPTCTNQGTPVSLALDSNGKPNCHTILTYIARERGTVERVERLVCEVLATASQVV